MKDLANSASLGDQPLEPKTPIEQEIAFLEVAVLTQLAFQIDDRFVSRLCAFVTRFELRPSFIGSFESARPVSGLRIGVVGRAGGSGHGGPEILDDFAEAFHDINEGFILVGPLGDRAFPLAAGVNASVMPGADRALTFE